MPFQWCKDLLCSHEQEIKHRSSCKELSREVGQEEELRNGHCIPVWLIFTEEVQVYLSVV